MLRVTTGDGSPEAVFNWYLDETSLEKVRTLAITRFDQTCVTCLGLSAP